ncbi:MAG: glycoside hydrolase family 5 protein, partial [Chitinophagaceae bacterium]|nr:glycoside hydrolase family 5 protein [Chitinophagaceae bacterium]
LGLNAFRVHVWDVEISDSAGNLLQNEHLRLFDFLLNELKKRNIKTIVTPIAFWGNGYPERDENTPGFARKYGKGGSVTNDTAIQAQENYLKQFFNHKNPYTGLTYGEDPDIIAMEINNEPNHGGSKPEAVTEYVNRMVNAVRSTGWTKPVYYNISENPTYASSVAKANVDGVTFQWYPTGLVANHERQGNFLPHVNRYTIPFDTIPEYRNKGKMVYEFDAADVLKPYLYPAMAKSFRKAGFNWATQFAYDPLGMADVNTEYQTHYLNLAYTPAKAISLMIAKEVFMYVDRNTDLGSASLDTAFGPFTISYHRATSEMNATDKFFHAAPTSTQPVDLKQLKQMAGVGSNPVVQYEGTGAWFLDKITEGVWRLEIMPDAIHIKDPFERASPKKQVTAIRWNKHAFMANIPDLGNNFKVKYLHKSNSTEFTSPGNAFTAEPGVYLLTANGKTMPVNASLPFTAGLNEFVAPENNPENIIDIKHTPPSALQAGRINRIHALILAPENSMVTLIPNNAWCGFARGRGGSRPITMTPISPFNYEAVLPAEMMQPGPLQYRIVVKDKEKYYQFPGGFSEDPFAWDSYRGEAYSTVVTGIDGQITLFDPTTDRALLHPAFRRGQQTSYVPSKDPAKLILKIETGDMEADRYFAIQQYVGDRIQERLANFENGDQLLQMEVKNNGNPCKMKITLITKQGNAFSDTVEVNKGTQFIACIRASFTKSSYTLLPRPFPGFMPLQFSGDKGTSDFRWEDVEKIELNVGPATDGLKTPASYSMEIGRLWLEGVH